MTRLLFHSIVVALNSCCAQYARGTLSHNMLYLYRPPLQKRQGTGIGLVLKDLF